MKFIADFFPVVLFFIAYQVYDIYVATVVAIAASVIQVGVEFLRQGQVAKMHLVTLGLLLFFGGLTLALKDPLFIKWKPTVVNWLFAAAFLGSQLFTRKSLVERMMSHAVDLPDFVWTRLNHAWTLFFLMMGGLNLFVAYNFSEETWVNFKLFGLLGFTLLFVILQSFYMARYMQPETNNNEES